MATACRRQTSASYDADRQPVRVALAPCLGCIHRRQSRSRQTDSAAARAGRPTTMPGIHRSIARVSERAWRNVEGALPTAGLSLDGSMHTACPLNRVMLLSSASGDAGRAERERRCNDQLACSVRTVCET